jgi:RNA polymerase sigma-70 factor (ECF subfamily)
MNVMSIPGNYQYTNEQLSAEVAQIEAAKRDPAAFGVLYEKFFGQIFMFLLRRVESKEIADDLCSQVFLKALNYLPKYQHKGLPFSSWLFRIARYELYTAYHKNKVVPVLSIDRSGIGAMLGDMNAEEKVDYSDLYQVLQSLSQDEMELIELRFFEGRAFKEIGELLDITENNAKVKTYRILDKLKTRFKKI